MIDRWEARRARILFQDGMCACMCVHTHVCMHEKTRGNGNTSVTTDNDAYSLLPPPS